MAQSARTMRLGEYFGDAVRQRRVFGFAFTENRFRPDYVIPKHKHALSHITCIFAGGFEEVYDHTKLSCTPGTLLVVPKERVHEDRIGPAGAHTLSVELGPNTLTKIEESVNLFAEPSVVSGPQVGTLIDRLRHEFHAPDDASLLSIAAITMELIVTAERLSARQDAPKNWMDCLVEELHRDPIADVSLAALAQKFGIHEAHMSRAFRRRHGSSIGEYVRWLRLERAKGQLACGLSTISEIAVDCGFYDQAHFSRAFKQQYGISPAAYRKQWVHATTIHEAPSVQD